MSEHIFAYIASKLAQVSFIVAVFACETKKGAVPFNSSQPKEVM